MTPNFHLVKKQSTKLMHKLLEMNPNSYSQENICNLSKFIAIRLSRYSRLKSFYCTNDILNETIIRLNTKLESGEKIHNPEAWMRTTAQNIIREKNRKEERSENLPKLSKYHSLNGLTPDVWLEQQEELELERVRCCYLRQAMQELPPEQKEILHLKYIQDLSWQEVASYLTKTGKDVKLSTLRKRGERAKKALRKAVIERISSEQEED